MALKNLTPLKAGASDRQHLVSAPARAFGRARVSKGNLTNRMLLEDRR